jgi:hypothetical protein
VYRRNPRADAERVSQVLAGMVYPAAKWQLLMAAEEYGADASTRAELWSLPTGEYADLDAVLSALRGNAAAEALPAQSADRSSALYFPRYPSPRTRAMPARAQRFRQQPAPQVAGRVRPLR